jgi:hypothetical protein
MKNPKGEIWVLGIINLFVYGKFVLIFLLISYFNFGLSLTFEPLWFYLFFGLLLFIPMKIRFDKKGIHHLLRSKKWKDFRYYKLKNNSLELYSDKNKTQKFKTTFFHQKNLELVLRKYCKPLKR